MIVETIPEENEVLDWIEDQIADGAGRGAG